MKDTVKLFLKTSFFFLIVIVGYAGYVLLTKGDCYLKDGNLSAAKKISVDVQYAIINVVTFGALNDANRIDENSVYSTIPFQQCGKDISLTDKIIREMEMR